MSKLITIPEPQPLTVTADMLPGIVVQLKQLISENDALYYTAARKSLDIGVGLLRIDQCSKRGTLTKIYKMLGKQASSAKISLKLARDFAEKVKGAAALIASDEARDISAGQLQLSIAGNEETPLQKALAAYVGKRSLRDLMASLTADDDDDTATSGGDSSESGAASPKAKALPVSGGTRTDGSDEFKRRELEEADAANALETLTHYVSGGLYAAHDDAALAKARDLFQAAHEAASELLAKRCEAEPVRKRNKR